jgi:hypothetical protein
LAERALTLRGVTSDADIADHGQRSLLGARRKRPRRRAANERDEFAPLNHSITSSARPRSVNGTVMPSALAVLRLMINSILVAC